MRPQDDANIQALVEAGPPVVTIFGKSWDFHVTSAIGTMKSYQRCGPL